MQIITTVSQMQTWARFQRAAGARIAFVPTMGYLHEGHLTLMRLGKTRAEKLVVSIFVNPLQFNVAEDLEKYPRDEAGDFAKCEAEGVDVMFYPQAQEIYPQGYQTRIHLPEISRRLEGEYRPGHLDGVATVVAKLFNMVQPDVAVFGEKDFQQLALVRRMVRDLNFPLEIVGGPTLRESDGLAMSSRNARLSPELRARAVCLSQALNLAKELAANGERDAARLIAAARAHIEARHDGRIDYIDIAHGESLDALETITAPAVMSLAVWFDPVRLIDNLRLV
jgi:pantoate--beta-alanine ligase